MKSAFAFWVDLFDTREAGTSLAAFRVLVASVVLYSLLSIAAADLVDVLWVDVTHGGYRPLGRGNWLMDLTGGPTPANVWRMWWLALGADLMLLIGLLGRLSALVTLQAYIALCTLNGNASGGYDGLIMNALWLLVLGSCSATLSVDCRVRRGRFTSLAPIPAWPRYLAIFQLAVMYTATGLQKLSHTWTPMGGYTALHWVFQDPTWLRVYPVPHVEYLQPLLRIGTAVTWHWEQLSPLLLIYLYYRHTRERPGRLRALFLRHDLRALWALVGLSLHIGILVALNVGPFSWSSMAYYVCLVRPDEWSKLRAGLALKPAFR